MSYPPRRRTQPTESDDFEDLLEFPDSLDHAVSFHDMVPAEAHPVPSFNPPDFDLSNAENDVPWLEKGVSSVVRGMAKPLQDWHNATLKKELMSQFIAAEKEVALMRMGKSHELSMRRLDHRHEKDMKRIELVQAEFERLDRYEAKLAAEGTLTAEAVYRLLYLREKLTSYMG